MERNRELERRIALHRRACKSSAMTQLTGFDLNYSMLDAYINLDKLEPSLRREMYADLRDGSHEELKKLRPGSRFDVV